MILVILLSTGVLYIVNKLMWGLVRKLVELHTEFLDENIKFENENRSR